MGLGKFDFELFQIWKPDYHLSLFGITEGVPENLVYLAWPSDEEEPEVWAYAGFDGHKFKDLERYFKWCLERE